MTMRFDRLPAFDKECKKLAKKYRSLDEDLEEFKRVVRVIPLGNSKHFAVLTQKDTLYILKARLFSRYLKGSSLRIIYAYWEQEARIEFIELYFKGHKETEDMPRIRAYLAQY